MNEAGVSRSTGGTKSYVYDATILRRPSVGPPSRSGFAGSWGYEGEGGGLSLVGNRWYDADTGRFLTRDPARDGSNWWAYVENDPVNAVDPTGLFRIDPDLRQKYPKAAALIDKY